ncbi:Gibberellin-regulated protein 8 [Bienertia sinuspersici]
MCCSKCKCVPSGPLADKSECPCYRDWKNKKGMDKCP